GENRMFGGRVQKWTHASECTNTPMTFSVFLPPQAEGGARVPAVYYLSGLTCTDDNFTQKACAQRAAAAHGLALVAPDTSPRGACVEGEDDAYDFGSGAGFYVDATVDKWARHYNMYSYITKELPALVNEAFPIDAGRVGITGHSMGGHGALTVAIRNPGTFRSVSAFSPICNPTKCPWGEKAFAGYLGSVAAGAEHDATEPPRDPMGDRRDPSTFAVLADGRSKEPGNGSGLKPLSIAILALARRQAVSRRPPSKPGRRATVKPLFSCVPSQTVLPLSLHTRSAAGPLLRHADPLMNLSRGGGARRRVLAALAVALLVPGALSLSADRSAPGAPPGRGGLADVLKVAIDMWDQQPDAGTGSEERTQARSCNIFWTRTEGGPRGGRR
ncbi:unnamed protein product, partial [Prorocentrum cordatum]